MMNESSSDPGHQAGNELRLDPQGARAQHGESGGADTPWVVMTTVASEGEAQKLARSLIEDRLAGCVQVLPGLTSHYHYAGQQHADPEWLLLIKTTAGRWAALEPSLAERHPYEEPEILALPACGWARGYGAWLARSVARSVATPEQDA